MNIDELLQLRTNAATRSGKQLTIEISALSHIYLWDSDNLVASGVTDVIAELRQMAIPTPVKSCGNCQHWDQTGVDVGKCQYPLLYFTITPGYVQHRTHGQNCACHAAKVVTPTLPETLPISVPTAWLRARTMEIDLSDEMDAKIDGICREALKVARETIGT